MYIYIHIYIYIYTHVVRFLSFANAIVLPRAVNTFNELQ